MLFSVLFTIALASATTAAPINLARQVASAVPPTYPDSSAPVTNEASTGGSVPPAAPAVDQTGELQGMIGGPVNPNGGADGGQSLEQPGNPAQPAVQADPNTVKDLQQAINDMNNVIAEIIKANDGVKQNI